MNDSRFLFGSASRREITILAGGCDSWGKILTLAEVCNSKEGMWKTLYRMNQPQKMCFRIFMDGKLYVTGGIGGPESKL